MRQGIKCLRCHEVIVSKHRHDFKWCSCKACYVDGGKDYLRYGGHAGYIDVVEVPE